MSKSLILRTCRADSRSKNGFVWPEVGQIAKAPDWDSTPECGNGLHGWLFGQGDHTSSNYLGPDALWIVAEVESNGIIMLGGKCKFPKALVLFKGDRKDATDYLIEHEPRAREVAVIGLTKSVGDKESGQVGALGFLTGGDDSTLTGGNRSTLTGGDDSTLTGGNRSTLTGGNRSTLTGGYDSTLTGGYDSTLTGGDESTLTGGNRSTLTGGNRSTLTGGNRSTLTGGDDSTLTGGYDSTLTGGYDSTLTGGYDSTLTGGDESTLTGGNRSTLTGGDDSTLTGGDESTLTGGNRSTLTGGYGSELRIRYWDNKAERYRTVIAYVGEDGIEANIAYRLDDSHKFVRAEQETEEAA